MDVGREGGKDTHCIYSEEKEREGNVKQRSSNRECKGRERRSRKAKGGKGAGKGR